MVWQQRCDSKYVLYLINLMWTLLSPNFMMDLHALITVY